VDIFWQDIRYGLRMLAKNPAFAVTVVAILAVGIGANTAVFSVVNAVMLRPLPYRDSNRIVTLWKQTKRGTKRPLHREYLFCREQNQVFESMAAYALERLYISGIDRSREVWTYAVSSDLFPLLGVAPTLGRGFLPEEEQAGKNRVVILSHGFWQSELGGASEALGTTLSLNGDDYVIVGIMPPGFECPFGESAPFWVPLVFVQDAVWPSGVPVEPLAHLKKGVSLAQARAAMAVVADRFRQTDPKAGSEWTIGLDQLLHKTVQRSRTLLLLLFGAAGFVLLIAIANVTNLFLVRATVRQREMAMRTALGASRGRVLRQMLTESLILSTGAGFAGLLIAFAAAKGLVRLCPAEIPRLQETGVDLSVLVFAFGASVVTGLLLSVAPAWRISEIHMSRVLKESGGRSGTTRRWRRLHGGLVVSQIGLSLLLLIGAALLVRSLIALQKLDLGFRPENVLAVEIRLPDATYPESEHCTAFFNELLRRVRALPDVRCAALAFGYELQLGETGWDITVSVSDHPPASPEETPRAKRQFVTPAYFETMGIKLLKGRLLTEEDGAYTVLADEELVRRLFPDTDPIGKTLIHDNGQLVMTIVGVTTTTRDFQTTDPAGGALYWRLDESRQNMILVARGHGDPMQLADAVRAQVAALAKDEVIHKIEPLETMLSGMLAPQRFSMILLSLFGGIALLVATIGIYGLLQYTTAQQTHDLAIRMALGARRADVLRMVLGQGLRLALGGVAVGLVGALILTRLLSGLVYGVTCTDPLTLASTSIFLVATAVCAGLSPARRAAGIDPMVALRHE